MKKLIALIGALLSLPLHAVVKPKEQATTLTEKAVSKLQAPQTRGMEKRSERTAPRDRKDFFRDVRMINLEAVREDISSLKKENGAGYVTNMVNDKTVLGGKTALHILAQNNSSYTNGKPNQGEKDIESITVLLLENGAQPDAEARDGLRPLFSAVQKGHVGMVRRLLEAGANPNLGNDTLMPLHLSAAYEKSTDVEIAAALIQYGANINAIHNKQTPLDYAKTKAMKDLLRTNGGKTSAELK